MAKDKLKHRAEATISKYIKKARQRAGLSLSEATNFLGYKSIEQLKNYERSGYVPCNELIKILCKYCSSDYHLNTVLCDLQIQIYKEVYKI